MESNDCPETELVVLAKSAWLEVLVNWHCGLDTTTALLRKAHTHSDQLAIAWTEVARAYVFLLGQRLDDCESSLVAAIGRFSVKHDQHGLAVSDICLALLETQRDNVSRALDRLLRLHRSTIQFCPEEQMLLENGLAGCYFRKDNIHHAVQHLVSANLVAAHTKNLRMQVSIKSNLSALLMKLGQYDLARKLAQEAWNCDIARTSDSGTANPNALSNLIMCLIRLGRYPDAMSNAKLLLKTLENQPGACMPIHLVSCAEAFALNGYPELAEPVLSKASELSKLAPNAEIEAHIELGKCFIAIQRQDYTYARTHAREMLSQPVELVGAEAHREAGRVLSTVASALGHRADAAHWKRRSEEIGREPLFGAMIASQIKASLPIEEEFDPLTERELACLSLAARGQSSADIGDKLDIKGRTVDFHIQNCLRKLHATNRQEAIAKAIAANIIKL